MVPPGTLSAGVATQMVGPDGLIPTGSRVVVFRQIFTVFLVLGTLVGVVVVSYMVYSAYKYREEGGRGDVQASRPGQLPSESGGGRKLFVSFGLSTVIVVSLILWTYGTLLYVEGNAASEDGDEFEVEVRGYRFGWEFVYPNNHTTTGTLRVPANETVNLRVTSEDVFHTFGVPGLRVKTDAIPGQWTDTWFTGEETGTYEARCFELCGAGHSYMTADVVVMEPSAFDRWYASTANNSSSSAGGANASAVRGEVVG
ncbi:MULTISPECIES: cytochrome c oxidase subunit II [Halorussus]|uniref:cytochrome c oxidase subunit II n=1 Tax=Halorussus TaxID=1070314 RepID=UPI00209E25D6|nr:cytochrome c oxidase subunit II [Halorussus vallis]USZ78135.1 cytochrome c oxidase subunit II [Halorussus vallis]